MGGDSAANHLPRQQRHERNGVAATAHLHQTAQRVSAGQAAAAGARDKLVQLQLGVGGSGDHLPGYA
jgi:hypothetical protein